MTSYSWNSNISNLGSNHSGLFDPFSENLGGLRGNWRSGLTPVSESSVLDTERGELVKAPGRVGKKGGSSEAKALALKSHSEAERRRRERINAHLATLRGLVPSNEKVNKFSIWTKPRCLLKLSAKVRQLKKNATEASKGLLIPMDADEVRVEPHEDGTGDGTLSVRASLCCDYKPELLSDLRRALGALHLNIAKAEVSTLGGRVKNLFIFTSNKERNGNDPKAHQHLVTSVHQALSSILDKVSTSSEYSPRTTLPNKRRRISFFDSSSSST
ncbi:hypothetical protein F0562_013880 [Nyssa sinensis]|uniref:BHLH domain-containing protein n=1 Tax=Nyssa sinensis TaxID=561372 RepID=A0A5J4ZM27_9ASTE|nr:hypothetical protein F0562_013880 [Nyssa sinensis]